MRAKNHWKALGISVGNLQTVIALGHQEEDIILNTDLVYILIYWNLDIVGKPEDRMRTWLAMFVVFPQCFDIYVWIFQTGKYYLLFKSTLESAAPWRINTWKASEKYIEPSHHYVKVWHYYVSNDFCIQIYHGKAHTTILSIIMSQCVIIICHHCAAYNNVLQMFSSSKQIWISNTHHDTVVLLMALSQNTADWVMDKNRLSWNP